jgi:hypothetical protein
VLARLHRLERDLPGGAGDDIGEGDLDRGTHVGAAGRTPLAEHAAERGVATAPEERLEDVLDAAEPTAARAPAAGTQAIVAEGVVRLPLLGVRQHLVGLRRLLELLLGFGVVLVDVGMELARNPAERLLDLGLGGASLDAEQLVVVSGHAPVSA